MIWVGVMRWSRAGRWSRDADTGEDRWWIMTVYSEEIQWNKRMID